MVIMQSDAKGVTVQMGLLTVDSHVDARHCFDGGRRTQVLNQLSKAGVKPHDWLLIASLLSRYTMWIQVKNKRESHYIP